MAGRARKSRAQAPIEDLIVALTADELRKVVSAAVDDHGDVERHVRLIAARAEDGLAQARDLLGLHARVCDAGVADPVKLAKWMVKFRFTDQDFFEADPVR